MNNNNINTNAAPRPCKSMGVVFSAIIPSYKGTRLGLNSLNDWGFRLSYADPVEPSPSTGPCPPRAFHTERPPPATLNGMEAPMGQENRTSALPCVAFSTAAVRESLLGNTNYWAAVWLEASPFSCQVLNSCVFNACPSEKVKNRGPLIRNERTLSGQKAHIDPDAQQSQLSSARVMCCTY